VFLTEALQLRCRADVMTISFDSHYFRGLPFFAKINPWLSATRLSKPAFLSALARCEPGGIPRAS
jgi:hypothetical protein